MHASDLLHPLIIASLPLAAGLVIRLFPSKASRIAAPAAAAAAVTALLLTFLPKATPGLARLDLLATTMALLVASLGAVVLRFATRYLDGDPGLSRFLSWMSLTLGSVLTVVTSNHLLLMIGAWTATSLCLHRLLLHHPDRSGAVFAARKKFVFSRLAEVSLLTAAILLHNGHGTWRIDELVSSIASGNHAGLPAAAFLLAFGAMLKSAQFPFHSWLPDTMDTPTPVSAFMHAGIINAGGFLVLRLAPVFTAAPSALWLLAVVGTVTAVFGAIVMLVQPGVKRSLAFSTIAQMGFMMIQCGLGAWGLALLHLVAHSLYKAHAFLRAGSTIGAVPRAAIPLTTPSLALGIAAGVALVAAIATGLHAALPANSPSPPVFLSILALGLSYGIARSWSGHRRNLFPGLAAATGIASLAVALHTVAGSVMAGPAAPAVPAWLSIFVALSFIGLFLFQSLLWRASAHPLGRFLYVQALNGFYIGTIANRLLNRLWPRQPLA
ncbi:NADH dehydrogenase subunit L [Haloferula helveola]|uniref:Probable inorganic carbon transporter subunit DabB n=1 Tax=Haloferula helveola TaxID=490095 RepID=A0ABM7RCM2_9BACT|nr:NADH dehydrogenase subunit L [Haloferula helveola]